MKNHTLKIKYLDLLQSRTNWGMNDDELIVQAKAMYAHLQITKENNDTYNSLEELIDMYLSRPFSKILKDSNDYLSPIQLDFTEDIPLVELFFNDHNFVLYTTEGIYVAREDFVPYKHIKNIVTDCFRAQALAQVNKSYFTVLPLMTTSKGIFYIPFELGVPFQPLAYFLNTMISNK